MSQRKRSAPTRRKNQAERPGLMRRRVLVTAGAVVVLGAAFAVAWDVAKPPPPPPPELEAVETFADLGTTHLAESSVVPEYNSDPPTSGPHSSTPAACGIYRQPVSDQAQLHSMEHGAVVIQYDPGLSQDQISRLEGIAWSAADEVILAPRPENPAPLALTSWTRRLLIDEVDVEVVTAFEREFGNLSPEGGARCPLQVDQTR